MVRIDAATAIGTYLTAGAFARIGAGAFIAPALIEFARSIAVERTADEFWELRTTFAVQIDFFAAFAGREIAIATFGISVSTRTIHTGLVAFTGMCIIA